MPIFLLLFHPLLTLRSQPYKPASRAWGWSQPARRAGLTAQSPHLPEAAHGMMSCLPPPLPSKPCRGLVWSLPEVRGEGVPFLCSIRHHLHLVAGCWLRWTQPCCWVHTLHGATTANTARCLLQLCLPLSVCHTSPAAFSCPDEWGDIWSSEISSLSASCRHQCEFVAVTSPVGCKVRQEDITAANLQKIIRSSAQLTAACFLAPIWDDFIIFLTCSGFTGLIIRVLPSSFFSCVHFSAVLSHPASLSTSHGVHCRLPAALL